eukprot:CAMPEP_0182932180 /NCGR_PEP_ID=MMETSP0105_2-20130417/30602_1 /TAXON_ID=81532 ORGANISM="Acanthoeca-like sp., Strain 10tr" /NCGR_SAMPLE_ID=MMETSP0105_2 /ASSEMBLY_ACC=CAM_ASM_000205 /LENGTH=166 /DNA_ID=CAMNT_0025070735 /DNA_START=379 /DNA_END=879 /DNA_ORIENTATION=+
MAIHDLSDPAALTSVAAPAPESSSSRHLAAASSAILLASSYSISSSDSGSPLRRLNVLALSPTRWGERMAPPRPPMSFSSTFCFPLPLSFLDLGPFRLLRAMGLAGAAMAMAAFAPLFLLPLGRPGPRFFSVGAAAAASPLLLRFKCRVRCALNFEMSEAERRIFG